MTSTLPPLVQAISGGLGSASASALTYPLDLINTRLQLDSPNKSKRRGGILGGLRLLLSIVYGNPEKGRKGLGWKALYDGLGSDLFGTVLSNFFYFYFYTFLRSISTHGLVVIPLLRNVLNSKRLAKPRKPTLLEDIVIGFIAGVAARAIATPLNVITLRLQAVRADQEDDESEGPSDTESESSRSSSPAPNEDAGMLDIAQNIVDETGWRGLWKGYGTAALLSINRSISLSFFQIFRRLVVYGRSRNLTGKALAQAQNLTPGEAFFVGAMASSIANATLYPLTLAKKRIQASKGSDTLDSVLHDAYMGTYRPHRKTDSKRPPFKHRGTSSYGPGKEAGSDVKGLYQGLSMSLAKGFLNQGMTFLVKGRIEQLVVDAYLRHSRLKV